MVGFIGALSSSLCILILVFITLLVGYIDSLLPEASLFKINESTYRYPIASYFIVNEMKEEVSNVLVRLQEDYHFLPERTEVGCTAGFDIQTEMAENIMAYNTIKLSSFDLPLDSIMEAAPVQVGDKLNYCYLEFKGHPDG